MTPARTLSVVVPVYNGADVLADTLESIRRQTLKPDEIIVIDDGSSDASAQIADRHPLKPHVIRLDRNRGVAFARNTGLVEASSDLVAFLDQDDLWMPRRVERLSSLFEANPLWQVLITSERVFGASEDRDRLHAMGHPFAGWIEFWTPRNDVLSLLDRIPDVAAEPLAYEVVPTRRLLSGSVTVTTSYVLPRRLSLQVGGFASWVRAADDWVLLQTLSRHTEIHRVDDPSVLYRVHPGNTSATTDWPMPLMITAAATRFGGGVVARGHEREPELVGRLSDSGFLFHHMVARSTTKGLRARADTWASWQLLATDREDRRRTSRRLIAVAMRSLLPSWILRRARKIKRMVR